MKQKIVIRVHMRCDKCRSKAMGLVGSTYGVEYVGVEGEDKNQLVVVGDGVDPANLTSCLRKKMGNAELLKVEVVSAGTKPAAKEEAATTVTTSHPQQWCPCHSRPPVVVYYTRPPVVVYPYPDGHCYESHTDSSCTIL